MHHDVLRQVIEEMVPSPTRPAAPPSGRGSRTSAGACRRSICASTTSAPRLETLVAEATVVRLGDRVGVADVHLFHLDDESVTVATGKGVYDVIIDKERLPAP